MPDKKRSPQLLTLVDYHHPILRQVTETVSFPLSDEDKHIIQSMIYSIQPAQLKAANAPWEAAVGMAANQWGINKRIFLYCPDGDTVSGLEVIINPGYEHIPMKAEVADFAHQEHSVDLDLCWESCFSVPLATGNVQRPMLIRVKYQNEKGEIIEKELQGWEARVWQHENDHLNGLLYDDVNAKKCIDKRNFSSKDEVEKFYASLRAARKEI